MLGTYADAVDVIKSKPAAAHFGWLVSRAYGEAVLDNFSVRLGTGANLAEDDPILSARNRLMAPEFAGKKMADRTRLAYVCKAFLMSANGQKMPRLRGGRVAPLSLEVDEPFPKIEPPLAETA